VSAAPLLEARRLKVHYPLPAALPWQRGGVLKAVDDLNFNLAAGETLGVVGESGCGKSTLARALVGLVPITGGMVRYRDQDLAEAGPAEWRRLRREIQFVFQDPLASLNPRMTVGDIVAEPLLALCPELGRAERERRAMALLERVGLSSSQRNRYPHEFSGGQCQRVGIARALVVEPRLLICDEPVSALDVSVQAQIINLLRELQQEQQLAMLFIAHDLAVVRHLSHRVMVMYLGRVMEQADAETLFAQPRHPYTRALMAAVPELVKSGQDAIFEGLRGDLPSAAHPPPGCVFASRCPMAEAECLRRVPALNRTGPGAAAACHFVAGAALAA
jgi:oligopeptide transport system ATP-binding protein